MRILIVEPDEETCCLMELMMKSEQFAPVVSVGSGEGAIELATAYKFDMILLALNLPDMSGYEVLQTLREVKRVTTPLIIVSGLAGVQDKVRGLWLGADDYVTKPFHRDELVARMRAVIRRCDLHLSSAVSVGTLTVDYDKKMVTVGGVERNVTKAEYSILEILVMRCESLVTKEQILMYLYADVPPRKKKILDVFICRLRQKIASGNSAHDAVIENVWGKGYVLRGPAQPDETVFVPS